MPLSTVYERGSTAAFVADATELFQEEGYIGLDSLIT